MTSARTLSELGAGADVTVLGAGPAGLSAAWELAAQGVRVLVLEAEPHVGGMAATVERNGYRFDHGGHRFLTRWPELLERVRKLLGEDALLVDRHSVVLREGVRIGYPLELPDLLRQLPWSRGCSYLASYAWEQLRRPARDESTFSGWMTRRFGAALYREFFAPYSERLWGMDPARLSSEWAPERIGTFDLGVALRRLLGSRSAEPRTYAKRFLYPRLGMGQLFTRMAAEVERDRSSIATNVRVDGFEATDGRLTSLRCSTCDGTVRLPARYVIATLPLPILARFADIPTRLQFRGLRLLNAMLSAPAELGSTWAYVSGNRGIVTRVQEPARRSPFMVPPGRGSLQLELPCTPGDAVWRADDAELWQQARGELMAAGLPVPDAEHGIFSRRLEHAYPVSDQEARGESARILAQLATLQNCRVAGRQARFSYIFADRAMEEGIAAARVFLGKDPPDPELAGSESACLTENQSLLG